VSGNGDARFTRWLRGTASRGNQRAWCANNPEALREYYDSRSGKGLGEIQYAGTAAFIIELILGWDEPDNLTGPQG
jgi:hypothetical protein